MSKSNHTFANFVRWAETKQVIFDTPFSCFFCLYALSPRSNPNDLYFQYLSFSCNSDYAQFDVVTEQVNLKEKHGKDILYIDAFWVY